MKLEGEGRLLRIFIGEADLREGRPPYAAIVRNAREEGLAGATVPRGLGGYGAHCRIPPSSSRSSTGPMPSPGSSRSLTGWWAKA